MSNLETVTSNASVIMPTNNTVVGANERRPSLRSVLGKPPSNYSNSNVEKWLTTLSLNKEKEENEKREEDGWKDKQEEEEEEVGSITSGLEKEEEVNENREKEEENGEEEE